MMSAKSVCTLICVCFLSQIGMASTSLPIVNIDPATDIGEPPNSNQLLGFNEPHISGTWGWSFYVSAPISITAVGWYDENRDGLSHEHYIGLWKDLSGLSFWPYVQTSSGFPSTVINAEQLFNWSPVHIPGLTDGIRIPQGTVAELDGPWRKTPLAQGPMVLSPGGYLLGGTDNLNSADSIRYGHTEFSPFAERISIDPRITIGGPGYSEGAGLLPPANFFLVSGVELGPMLFAEPVPEQTTGLLLLLGVVLIRLQRWCR